MAAPPGVEVKMKTNHKGFSEEAFTFIELIAVITILLVLTSMALPLARNQIVRGKEVGLREDLRMMRDAIDRYHDDAEKGKFQVQAGTENYPPDLQTLRDGIQMSGQGVQGGQSGQSQRIRYLREIPVDPMTGNTDWGLRSVQDDPDSTSWGGQDVFDVYSKSQATGLDGTRYSDW